MSQNMDIEEIDIEQTAINFINEFNNFFDYYSDEGNVKEGAEEEVNNNLDKYEQDYVNIKSYIHEQRVLIDSQISSSRNEFPNQQQVSRIAFLSQIEKSLEEDQQILDRIQYLRNVYPLIPDSNTNDVPMNSNDSFPGPVSGPVYDPDPEIHHIFLFIAHGEEYNISGNRRHYYPFDQGLFESIGIISKHGIVATGDDLRSKLTLNRNIYDILGNCDLNGQAAINGKNLVTVNPLRLQFRFEDSTNEHLGPYMGLFYIKARGGENNQAELLHMKHIVSFQDAALLTQVDSIPRDDQHKYTLHNITREEVYIEENFNDNEWFGWDRVINFIANFYNQGLQISDGERPLIIHGEQTHIRLYTCRAQAVYTGPVLGVPTILTEYALYNANAEEYNNHHNLRYFTADENNMDNFVINNHINNNNQSNFQVFIDDFVNALNSDQYKITVNPNMLLVYLLSLIDKNVLDQNNKNIFLERVSCIFTDVENNDIEQLFVMMTLDKNGVDEYILRKQDISTFSTFDMNMEDIGHFLQDVEDIEIDLNIESIKAFYKSKKKKIVKNNKIAGNKIYFIGYSSLGTVPFPCVLFINYFDKEFQTTPTTISLAMIYINNEGYYTHGYEKRIVTENTTINLEIEYLLRQYFTGIKIIYSIGNITSGGMSNLGNLSKEHEKAQKEHNIIPIIKPTVYEFQEEKDSEFLNQYTRLEALKAKKRAEKAKKIAKESETGASEESQYVFKTPKKESTLKDPNSAASGKTDSLYSPYSPNRYPSSPLFQSIENADHRQGSKVLMGVSDPSKVLMSVSEPTLSSMRGSPSYEQLERLVPNDAASDATSGDSGPSSKTTTPATSPQRKKNPTNKNPTNDDSQGNTQTEMDTQPDEPLEFGGKKKGKKGKKTKRANNAKKARKTKKKRSNKK
jgi:hypothetical protein